MNIVKYKMPIELQRNEIVILSNTTELSKKLKSRAKRHVQQETSTNKLPSPLPRLGFPHKGDSFWNSSKYRVLPELREYLPENITIPAQICNPIKPTPNSSKSHIESIPQEASIIDCKRPLVSRITQKPRKLERSYLALPVISKSALEGTNCIFITSVKNPHRHQVPVRIAFSESPILSHIQKCSKKFKEGIQGYIILSEASIEACDVLCEYLLKAWTGDKAEIRISNPYEVCDNAAYLQVDGLVQLCIKKIADSPGKYISFNLQIADY